MLFFWKILLNTWIATFSSLAMEPFPFLNNWNVVIIKSIQINCDGSRRQTYIACGLKPVTAEDNRRGAVRWFLKNHCTEFYRVE